MNPMRAMKLMVRELIVDGGRLWRATGFAVLWAILGLGLASGFPVAAQEPDAARSKPMTLWRPRFSPESAK